MVSRLEKKVIFYKSSDRAQYGFIAIRIIYDQRGVDPLTKLLDWSGYGGERIWLLNLLDCGTEGDRLGLNIVDSPFEWHIIKNDAYREELREEFSKLHSFIEKNWDIIKSGEVITPLSF